MKFQTTFKPFYFFLLLFSITVGVIFSARAQPSAQQDVSFSMAKSAALDLEGQAREGRDHGKDLYNSSQLTHFEPLLLFMLGTVLLSIVTGINLLRSKKIGWQLPANSQPGLPSPQAFGAPTRVARTRARARKESAA